MSSAACIIGLPPSRSERNAVIALLEEKDAAARSAVAHAVKELSLRPLRSEADEVHTMGCWKRVHDIMGILGVRSWVAFQELLSQEVS